MWEGAFDGRGHVLWTVHETDLGRRVQFVLTGGSEDIQRIRKEFDDM